jgi:hypothetical protein
MKYLPPLGTVFKKSLLLHAFPEAIAPAFASSIPRVKIEIISNVQESLFSNLLLRIDFINLSVKSFPENATIGLLSAFSNPLIALIRPDFHLSEIEVIAC